MWLIDDLPIDTDLASSDEGLRLNSSSSAWFVLYAPQPKTDVGTVAKPQIFAFIFRYLHEHR